MRDRHSLVQDCPITIERHEERVDMEVSDIYLWRPRQMDKLSLEIAMIESENSTVSGDVRPLYEAKAALFMA